ncbi:16583_t:CDS:1, partial [Funneliformis geosporum]
EQRTQARINNSTIRDDLAHIEPLLSNAGIVPNNFPSDMQDIKNANATVINGLLTAYNQPIAGNLDTRKKRLTEYLGIRILSL